MTAGAWLRAGARELISAMIKLQSQSTSNPTSIAQYAARSADRPDGHRPAMLRNATYITREIASSPDFAQSRSHLRGAGGAFYAFPSVAEHSSHGPITHSKQPLVAEAHSLP